MVTQVRLKELLSYNPLTGQFIRLIATGRHGCHKVGEVAGHLRNDGKIDIKVSDKKYKAHRLAWFYMTGVWPTEEIDHIDLNKSNNRWDNLREATHVQNQYNKRKSPLNKSGYKGVSWCKQTQKWRAQIVADKKHKNIGRYDTLQEAYVAYCAAALIHHGKFARVE